MLIDEQDKDLLTLYSYSPHSEGYMGRNLPRPERGTALLHRDIMERMMGRPLLTTELVDHENRDKNDNRRSNLRLVSHNQNHMNSKQYANNKSGVTGVSWDEGRSKWTAYIQVEGRRVSLGRYDEFEDAVEARKRGEEEHYGEHARR